MAFCPNLSDNDVAADFYAIVDRTNDNIAYNLWNKFEGDVDAIDAFINKRLGTTQTSNPVIRLAERYNISNTGFANRMIDKANLTKEARELGLNVKEAESGGYYLTKNGRKLNPWRDAYQLEKNEKENPIQELQDKLTRWADANGIEVLAMEDLMNRMKGAETFDNNIIGVADIANKLIGLAEGKIALDTLPEEVAHFMVNFMINDPSIQRALELSLIHI